MSSKKHIDIKKADLKLDAVNKVPAVAVNHAQNAGGASTLLGAGGMKVSDLLKSASSTVPAVAGSAKQSSEGTIDTPAWKNASSTVPPIAGASKKPGKGD